MPAHPPNTSETDPTSDAGAPRPVGDATRAFLTGLASAHDVVVAIDDENQLAFVADEAHRLGDRPPATLRDLEASQAGRDLLEALATDGTGRGWRAFSAAIPGSERERPLRVALFADAEGKVPTEDAPVDSLLARNEELEICLRSVSHDLRSPLVSVLGFTRLLRDDFGEAIGRTGQHFVGRIEQAGKQMERLLHDLLELTRIGETPPVAVHVQPLAVLEQLAAELKLRLEEADVVLELPENAPILVCDRTRLYQVFSNLIGNALAHMHREAGGRIRVRIDEAETGWQIDVEDNGPGIPIEEREALFEPFRTGSPGGKSGRKRSTGLGLAIVRKIVEMHGGRIWIEGEPGEGAVFRIWLDRPALAETGDPRGA